MPTNTSTNDASVAIARTKLATLPAAEALLLDDVDRNDDPGISVVIPAWNEEAWIPRLLDQLLGEPWVSEVIVADNSSDDQTVHVASSHEARVVTGGRPAFGRNRGAEASSSSWILFLDADVVLSRHALEFLRRVPASPDSCDLIAFRHVPISESLLHQLLYNVVDLYVRAGALIGRPVALASALLISSNAYSGSGGFDEAIEVGEDVEFVRRASKGRRFAYRRDVEVLVSPRRLLEEGPFKFAGKTLLLGVLRFVGIKQSPVGYKWIPHDPMQSVREQKVIKNLERAQ